VVLRERVLVPRDFVLVLRGDFAALPPLFAADERAEPVPVDLALVEVLRAPVVDDFARPAVFRVPLASLVEDLRPALPRLEPADDDELEPDDVLALPSIDHLPLITRCAASATASAMIEPSLVALETTLLAAADAVSAASRPASRILRRAAGLALIAAAAAARPAASISLLIAALASLSMVSLPEVEREEEPLFGDLAIA
jgi:hypothetical protein